LCGVQFDSQFSFWEGGPGDKAEEMNCRGGETQDRQWNPEHTELAKYKDSGGWALSGDGTTTLHWFWKWDLKLQSLEQFMELIRQCIDEQSWM
jgi:hypothetical protein